MSANILVVEDDSALVDLIEYNLTATGYREMSTNSQKTRINSMISRAFDEYRLLRAGNF